MNIQKLKEAYLQIVSEDQIDDWFKRFPPYKTQSFVNKYRSIYPIYFNSDGTIPKSVNDSKYRIVFMTVEENDLIYLDVSFGKYDETNKDFNVKQSKSEDQVEAIRVFTTVISEIIKFYNSMPNHIDVIEFAAYTDEPSRVRLYDTFAPLLAKKLNFKLFTRFKSIGMIYTLAKDERKVE